MPGQSSDMEKYMGNRLIYRLVVLTIIAITSAVIIPAVVITAARAGEKSPVYRSLYGVAISKDGQKVYASDQTADSIITINTKTDEKIAEWPVPGEPTGLALSADGKILYMASRKTGTVAAVDTTSGKLLLQADVGVRPMCLALGERTGRLYVCNTASNSISVLDLKSFKVITEIPVGREPRFAALTPDETMLLVSNSLPNDPSDAKIVAGTVSVIDTRTLKVTDMIKLCNGATNLRGIAVSPDGAWAYCVHTVSRFNVPTSQLDRGWMNTSGLSIIDLRDRKLDTTVLLDSIDRGAADPDGIVLSPGGTQLYISLSGTHEIEAVDIGRLRDLLDGRLMDNLPEKEGDPTTDIWRRIKENPEARLELVNDLGAMDCMELIHRFPSGGTGPRGICIAPNGKQLYTANYFSGTLTAVDTVTGELTAVINSGIQPQESLMRKGERVFQDASICYQTWQSCATCHPDGRNDGLRWDLLNDGTGNPKKTRSLVRSFEISPVMSRGVRANAKVAVRAGFRFILFNDNAGDDADAVDAYLKSLPPEPSPFRSANGALNASAERGKKLFFGKAGCGNCHQGPIFTDMQPYEVIPPASFDHPGDRFITTRLVELYRTAPYLHDGRAATLMDVLTTFNKDDRHGITSGLNKQELQDLVEFLRSL